MISRVLIGSGGLDGPHTASSLPASVSSGGLQWAGAVENVTSVPGLEQTWESSRSGPFMVPVGSNPALGTRRTGGNILISQ